MTGWTFDQIDEAPAYRLDRLLAVDNVVNEVRAEKQREASRG